MPDISMCDNKKCPSRKSCYRYMAIPNIYQCFASFSPGKKQKCEYYCKVRPTDRITEKE